MSENEFAVVLLLTGAAGGAWGARSSGTQAWRGAVIVALSMLMTLAIFVAFSVDNGPLTVACNIAILTITGGALKMSPRQIATSAMGAILLGAVVGVIVAFVSPVSMPFV